MKWTIPFYRHDLGEAELGAVGEVLAQPILTTGEVVGRFEAAFAAWTGRRHVLAVTSCTGAMHLSLIALGIGQGDEVITTPLSFIATATAILEAGATPVFVDVEPETGNIDAGRIERAITARTKAILPVHLYGLMVDMPAIRQIAQRHGLAVIEDAAHCVEGARAGVRPGELSEAVCYSFYATKNLTCGEGGALATDDEKLYRHLKLLRLHGMTKTAADRHREGYVHWDMTVLGWKYNMSNIEAALLLPQLDRLGAKLADRHRLAARYEAALAGQRGIRLQAVPEGSLHARHLFAVRFTATDRDAAILALRDQGIETVVNYRPIHLTQYFRERFGFRPGDFPVAEAFGEQTLSLPFYPGMPVEHVDQVADAVVRLAEAQAKVSAA
jgi:UDP-4-amino-4-deoxy-L-arabinose-oxoglutarate aminotransferase